MILHWLHAQDQGFNAWRLVSLSPLPWWVLALCFAILLLALLWSRRALSAAGVGGRWALLTLRGLAVLVLLGLLLEPGAELMQTVKQRGRLAVVLDSSASMNLLDGDQSRWVQAKTWLAEHSAELQRLSERFDLEYYRFSQQLERMPDLDTVAAAPAQGARTDLLAFLKGLNAQSHDRKLGGVILIADGADNVSLKQALSVEAKNLAKRLDAPIWVQAMGVQHSQKDLSIAAVMADDFAFVRNPLDIEVEVQAHGFGAQQIPVSLRERGQVVAVQKLQLKPDTQSYKVAFHFVPRQTGQQTFRVEVPVLADESIRENNQRSFTLKVIRDRIRVLQVVGRPSWDVRFLRQLLKANPSVDLISFFILRTQSDAVGRNDELSLIPFPTEELFTQELKTFDVVILQNFNFLPYHMARYLPNIRDFVIKQGGAFVMVGGDLSFAEAGYQDTAIADILPVVLPMAGHYQRNSFAPKMTSDGARHPILDLGRGDRAALLAQLPELKGFNSGARATPGAQVLLCHPYERVQGELAPVLAVREIGKGRSMALLTDDSWFWSLPDSGHGGRGSAHRRLWANALRWLMRDPALAKVRIELAQQRFDPGEAIPARLRALRDDYGPEVGAKLSLSLKSDEGLNEPIVWEQDWTSGPEGEVQVQIPGQTVGAYRMQVRAQAADGQTLGQDEAVFVVRGQSIELSDPRARPQLLEALAEISGGGRLDKGRSLDEIDFADAATVQVARAQQVPIWNRWPVLALLLGLLAGEWWLRRRLGFS